MEATLCKKAVEGVRESKEYKSIISLLSYTDSNKEVMKDPLKNKEIAMCILSKLVYSYDDTDKINEVIKNWGLEYKLIILDTLVYIIFYSKEYIFIVFKGTTNFSEVLSDIDFIQIDDYYNIPGKMHKGFHNLILKNKVVESIEDTLKTVCKDTNIPIIVTGHSLGAALATIFYAYLKNKGEENLVELITFGSPRVGDNEFSKNLKSTRIVHGNDIITKLPIFKYKHTENLIRVGSSYSYRLFTDHLLEGYYLELIKTINLPNFI